MLERVWRKGNTLTLWWEYKLVQPLWKILWRFLKKLKVELPYHPGILLLGIYPDKIVIQEDTCIPMFIVALFTTAKTWKQLSINRWTDKEDVVHICNGILLSHKKDWNNVICSNLDATRDHHTKSGRKRKTNTIWYHLNVESKIWHKWTYLWNRNRHTDIESRLVVAMGEGWNGRLGLADVSFYV